LNAAGLLGFGIEIGAAEGGHAEYLRKEWKGKKLWMVDPWIEQPVAEYIDGCNQPQAGQDANMADCYARMTKFPAESYEIIRGMSLDVVTDFPDHYFDFVYLDGNHNRWAIEADILAWLLKMKTGGVFAGHDYVPDCATYGVQAAVNAFCQTTGRQLFVIPGHEFCNPSWAVIV
jgi:hypothetical protein